MTQANTNEHPLPSLSATDDEPIALDPLAGEQQRPSTTRPPNKQRHPFIWLALAGLAGTAVGHIVISQQQINLLEQQIIATQESFASISGDTSQHVQSLASSLETRLAQLEQAQAQQQSAFGDMQAKHTRMAQQLDQTRQQLSASIRNLEQLEQSQAKQAATIKSDVLELDKLTKQVDSRLATALYTQVIFAQQLEESKNTEESIQQQVKQLEEQLQTSKLSQDALLTLQQSLQSMRQQQVELEQELQAFRAQTTRSLLQLKDSTPSP